MSEPSDCYEKSYIRSSNYSHSQASKGPGLQELHVTDDKQMAFTDETIDCKSLNAKEMTI
jgi:hypothetical protein